MGVKLVYCVVIAIVSSSVARWWIHRSRWRSLTCLPSCWSVPGVRVLLL